MARYHEDQREEAYRIYVTDGLYSLCHGGLNMRYADIFTPVDTRDPEEVISNIREKLIKLGGE